MDLDNAVYRHVFFIFYIEHRDRIVFARVRFLMNTKDRTRCFFAGPTKSERSHMRF